MTEPVVAGRFLRASRLSILGVAAGLFLVPALAGCPGTLDPGAFPSLDGGTGGMNGTGTGGSGMTGSGGSGMSGSGGGSGTVCDAPTKVLPGCVSGLCHKPTGPFTPDLMAGASDGTMKTRLAGSTAIYSMSTCNGQPIINSADRASSTLLKRIQGTSCGPQMPNDLPPLNSADMECLTSWVTAP